MTTRTRPTARLPTADALPSPSPDIALPLEFRAFHTLHKDAYLAYAAAHTTTHAVDLVRGAFGTLAVNWTTLLRSSNPTATAWDQVAAHIARRTRRLPLGSVSPLQYQLAVLHQLARLSITAAAETTGRDHATACCLLSRPYQAPAPAAPRPSRRAHLSSLRRN
ncbi:hypothetical protein [Streptomyces sp. IB2014 016-6]|uniref:hypothetical protein n=1 Tax=Streptomyces sp. IB2014 016-6 TaxID=2517818 RepID=UPI0011C7552B|nr:hypothetical protein [Streptomyces sp. IB2014 016-6]TXL84724.1 hypothetical protein EW053_33390 [Streptomyces sp. IB2014 016-6]